MKRITTGTENFKDLLDKNYYYIDKMMLIEDVFGYGISFYKKYCFVSQS